VIALTTSAQAKENKMETQKQEIKQRV